MAGTETPISHGDWLIDWVKEIGPARYVFKKKLDKPNDVSSCCSHRCTHVHMHTVMVWITVASVVAACFVTAFVVTVYVDMGYTGI